MTSIRLHPSHELLGRDYGGWLWELSLSGDQSDLLTTVIPNRTVFDPSFESLYTFYLLSHYLGTYKQ